MSANEEINHAIAAHGMWKSRLKSAIDAGKSEYSPSVVATDDHCDFGKWLKGAGPELTKSAHFKKCTDLHRQFHKAAANVLTLALAGKKSDASNAMGGNAEFTNVSSSLVTELMAWAKEAP